MTEELQPLQERVLELELRYMHQERYVEQLSDEIREHQKSIDELWRVVRTLRDQLLFGEKDALKDEPPPHY